MTVVYRHNATLPWTSSADDEKRFLKVVSITMLVGLFMGVAIPQINLPDIVKKFNEVKKPQIVSLVLVKPKKKKPIIVAKKIPPKPKRIIKKQILKKEKLIKSTKKIVVTKKAKQKKIERKQQTSKKPRQKIRQQPKPKNIESMGLLAFSDDLGLMKSSMPVNSITSSRKLITQGAAVKKSRRSVITTDMQKGSGGIKVAKVSHSGLPTKLKGFTPNKLANTGLSSGDKQKPTARTRTTKYGSGRSSEEIQLVFDKNKGAIFALYNRELRKDPGLQGKVIVELTIAPNGVVKKCRIVSTQLNNAKLEVKLVSRIRSFKFDNRDVDTVVATYPIDFLPS